jgi:putative transposase
LKGKVGLAKRLSQQFAVRLCCSCLQLNPSTYYKVKDRVEDKFEVKYKNLKNKIKRIIVKNPAYGYRRLKDELKDRHSIIVNAKALRKLLKLWNFNILRRVHKPQRGGIEQIIEESGPLANLVKTLAPQTIKPFQLVYIDITEITCKTGKLYLIPFLDHLTKKIIGYGIAKNPNTENVLKAFNKALRFLRNKKTTLSKVIIHQDQGSVFKSYQYVQELVKRGIALSYSRKARPGDNPEMESFFGRLKTEKKHLFVEAETLEELEKEIHHAIKYYNTDRRHSKLGNKSPERFIQELNLNLQAIST